MVLGDFFPPQVREAITEQRLKPGAVLYLEVTFPEDGKTKEKYLVMVASVEPNVLTLVINTEINPFIAARPELNRCQLVIEQADHPFLDYDSYLACHKALVLPRDQIDHDLLNDMSRYKGEITDAMKRKIIGALETKPKQISATHRDAIIAALSAPVGSDSEPTVNDLGIDGRGITHSHA